MLPDTLTITVYTKQLIVVVPATWATEKLITIVVPAAIAAATGYRGYGYIYEYGNY